MTDKNQTEVSKTPSDAERALRAMIDALVLTDPSLKGRLNVGACLHYLKLDDRIFGWNGDLSKPLTLEQKIACVMPTIANGLPPGYVVWMGNRPYALADAWVHVVNRDVEKVSGLRWCPLTEEENKMFGISASDMAVAVEETVCLRGREIQWVGYGILGADELVPNAQGKHRAATRLTRDKAQFLRTRAIRDMYRRNYSLSGLSELDEIDFDDQGPKRPLENVTPLTAPADTHAMDSVLKQTAINRFQSAAEGIRSLGGRPEDFVKLSLKDWLSQASVTEVSDVADALEYSVTQRMEQRELPMSS